MFLKVHYIMQPMIKYPNYNCTAPVMTHSFLLAGTLIFFEDVDDDDDGAKKEKAICICLCLAFGTCNLKKGVLTVGCKQHKQYSI